MVIFKKNFGRLSEVTFLVKAYFFTEFVTIVEPAGQFLLTYLTTEEQNNGKCVMGDCFFTADQLKTHLRTHVKLSVF